MPAVVRRIGTREPAPFVVRRHGGDEVGALAHLQPAVDAQVGAGRAAGPDDDGLGEDEPAALGQRQRGHRPLPRPDGDGPSLLAMNERGQARRRARRRRAGGAWSDQPGRDHEGAQRQHHPGASHQGVSPTDRFGRRPRPYHRPSRTGRDRGAMTHRCGLNQLGRFQPPVINWGDVDLDLHRERPGRAEGASHGIHTSATAPPSRPLPPRPMTRTRPSDSSVAVPTSVSARGPRGAEGAGLGIHTSATAPPSRPLPARPMTRTRPSDRSVVAWGSMSGRERSSRAEGAGLGIPDLRHRAGLRALTRAADDEDAPVG